MEVLTISITVVLLAAIIAKVVLSHRNFRAEEYSYTVTPRKIQTKTKVNTAAKPAKVANL